MTPHFSDDWLTVYGGDAREVLPELASDSVDCIVTSPPYWGLRDYGTATWSGGDEGCDHNPQRPDGGQRADRELPLGRGGMFRDTCDKCGATRQDSQLGLEATPEEYVANLVGVFRELRRVLKPSGTCWLNLGDSYASGGTNNNGRGSSGLNSNPASDVAMKDVRKPRVDTLKPKDLVGIPWRVAFALQADGWYLRSDIIWAKPNPMPESVTDRPTKAHEYLFLLSKSPRYYFDQEAVREPVAEATYSRLDQDVESQNGSYRQPGKTNGPMRAVGTTNGRNLRSVWTIATRPYPGAHFAVFPPELPERCIKAGSSERGVCPECGAPWERVVERTGGPPPGDHRKREGFGGDMKQAHETGTVDGSALSNIYREYGYATLTTTGWRPTCSCERGMQASSTREEPVPATILDPFAGSGTVGLVANRLSRRAILIDLNPAYLEQQMKRNAQVPVGL